MLVYERPRCAAISRIESPSSTSAASASRAMPPRGAWRPAGDSAWPAARLDARCARRGCRGGCRQLPGTRPDPAHPSVRRRPSLPCLSQRCRGAPAARRQGDPRRGSRRSLRRVRVLDLDRRPALPPSRPEPEGLRSRKDRPDPIAGQGTRRGGEVRPALRDLPRRDREGGETATLLTRACRQQAWGQSSPSICGPG